jgi:hypothetical protein
VLLLKRFLFYSFIFSFYSCTTIYIPHKSKSEIQREFKERYYYDDATQIGFKKYWNWKFASKNDAQKIDKHYLINAIEPYATPIYAAVRNSFDDTNEFSLVFKVDNDKEVKNYLDINLQVVDTLLYNSAYSYKNIKSKSVSLYYKHHKNRKQIICASYIFDYKNNNKYLSIYLGSYKNVDKYLKQFEIWDESIGRKMNNAPTYKEGRDQYGLDTILQLQGFHSQSFLFGSIGLFENYKSLNIYKIPDSLMIVNGELSYQNSLELLISNFNEDFFEEEHYVDLQIYLQTKAVYHTLLSDHKSAIESENIYKAVDNKFLLPAHAKILSAKEFILNSVKERKIIAFNEAHHDIRARSFVLSLMDSLKAIGFTHIAFEGLVQAPIQDFLTHTSGYYIREPMYNNLVLYAKKLGFKIIAYEQQLTHKKNKREAERDKVAANTLLKEVDFRKGDKLIVFCGYGHIDKADDKTTPVSLIDYLWAKTKVEPLTIDLAYPRTYYVMDTAIDHFYILDMDRKGQFHKRSGSNGDISVYPPNGKKYFDFNYYYEHKIVPLKKEIFAFKPDKDITSDEKVTIYVYKDLKQGILQIPVFTSLINNEEQDVNIFIIEGGEYLIEVRNIHNKVIQKHNFKLF